MNTIATLFALAQVPVVAEMTDQQALEHLIQGLGGLKGAGALGIAIFVTQIVMAVARTPLADKLGKFKLIVVTGVSVVATVLAGKSMGQTWLTALMSAPVVAALQVFGHQVIAQFTPEASAPASDKA